MTEAKTTGGNYLEDFEVGRVIKHAVPRTVWDGDMARYVALYGDRRPLHCARDVAQAVGFGAAVDYISNLGMPAIRQHEQEMIERALDQLEEVPGVRIYGPAAEHKGAVAAFTLSDAHPHDIAEILDRRGVAVRAGHHCAMPLHEKLGLPATTRASFYLYNTPDEIDSLIEGLYDVKKVFA